MKRKRKWFYLSLIIVLTGIILFLYQSFNGNPVSKVLAGKALESYLAERYTGEEFNVSDGFYNFKSGGYSYDVTKVGPDGGQPHEFELVGILKPEVSYDGIYYDSFDNKLIEKLQREANNELSGLLDGKAGNVLEVGTMMELLEGTYPPDTEWSKDLKLEKPFDIYFIIDAEGMDQKEMLAASGKIQAMLDAEQYDYERVNVNGNIVEKPVTEGFETGYVRYSLAFNKGEKISLKDIEEIEQ